LLQARSLRGNVVGVKALLFADASAVGGATNVKEEKGEAKKKRRERGGKSASLRRFPRVTH
jgi:hypothetical protein